MARATRGHPPRKPRQPRDARRHPTATSNTPSSPRRRPRTLIAVAICAGLAIATAIGWKWRAYAHVDVPDNRSAPPPTASTVDSIRAEFEQDARRLFNTPGGQMDRTRASVVRRVLAQAGDDWKRAIAARVELVNALLVEARPQDAVQEAESLVQALKNVKLTAPDYLRILRLRGLAYLRQAEIENCVNRHNNDCCVFPLKGGGVHEEKTPAQKAAAAYLAYLKAQPDDLAIRWLLNITHMAMGTYPDSVPPEYRIPEKGPNSSDDFPRFRDVAKACGLTRLNHAGGSVVDDMDGDGLLDIVFSSCCPDVPLALYRNRGDGTFEDRAEAAKLGNQLGGLNLVSTDYDNDGDLDLFVLRGGWLFEEGRIRKSLLRNNGDGAFTDVTHAAGLADTRSPSQAAAWFDFDNDGDLDVFLGNESCMDRSVFPEMPPGKGNYPSQLFRNNGDGTFTDIAPAAGVTNNRYCKGVAAGDYNNDGWTDLYVSNIGRNRLYRNNGNGTFTDVAETLGVTEPAGRSFATWFFDFDNDGNLDIFVAAYEQHLEDIPAWYLGLPFKSAAPRLYRNKGDGTFEDVTRAAGLWRPLQPMGANFGDLNNDGWLDIYLTTGNPDYEALMPDVMLRNLGGARFDDVTVAGGFGNLQKGHGAAFADLDHDGDQDVVHEVGGFLMGDAFYNSLYENPGSANRYLMIKLIGSRSNRLAYGARIKVVVRTPNGERAIHRAVGAVSSFGGSPSRQEIGLGDALSIQSIELFWPATGIRQTFSNVEMDSFYELTEGHDALKKLSLKRYTLGGA